MNGATKGRSALHFALAGLCVLVVSANGTCAGGQCATDETVLLQGKLAAMEVAKHDPTQKRANLKLLQVEKQLREIVDAQDAKDKKIYKLNGQILETLEEVRSISESHTLPKDDYGRESIAKITSLVTDTLIPGLKDERDYVQESLYTELNPIHECNSLAEGTLNSTVATLQTGRNALGEAHQRCRTIEISLEEARTYSCSQLNTTVGAFGPPSNPESAPSGSEKTLDKIAKYLEDMVEWNATKKLADLVSCRDHCYNAADEHDKKTEECHVKQGSFETEFCEWRRSTLDTKSTLNLCHERHSHAFNQHVLVTETHVRHLKTGYSGAKMIECYLQVWTSDNDTSTVDKVAHDTCKSHTVDTSPMDVDYPNIPPILNISSIPNSDWQVDMHGLQSYPGVQQFRVEQYEDNDLADYVRQSINCSALPPPPPPSVDKICMYAGTGSPRDTLAQLPGIGPVPCGNITDLLDQMGFDGSNASCQATLPIPHLSSVQVREVLHLSARFCCGGNGGGPHLCYPHEDHDSVIRQLPTCALRCPYQPRGCHDAVEAVLPVRERKTDFWAVKVQNGETGYEGCLGGCAPETAILVAGMMTAPGTGIAGCAMPIMQYELGHNFPPCLADCLGVDMDVLSLVHQIQSVNCTYLGEQLGQGCMTDCDMYFQGVLGYQCQAQAAGLAVASPAPAPLSDEEDLPTFQPKYGDSKLGWYCTGSWTTVRKQLRGPGVTQTKEGCARAAHSDPACGTIFYHEPETAFTPPVVVGVDDPANTDLTFTTRDGLCRCVRKGQSCTLAHEDNIPSGLLTYVNHDDASRSPDAHITIYEFLPGHSVL